MELSHGKYIPIGEFMLLHINKNMYYKHVKTAYIKKRDTKSSSSNDSSGNEGLKKSTKKIIAATGTKSTRMNRANINNPNHIPYELPQPTSTVNSLVDVDEFKEMVITDNDYSTSSRKRSSMSMKVTMIGSTTASEDDDHSVHSTNQTYGGSKSTKNSSSSSGRLVNGARSWGNPHTYNKNENGSGFTRARNNTIMGSSSSSSSKSGSQSTKVRRGTII